MIEPILEYAKARRVQLERQPEELVPGYASVLVSPKGAALEELRRVIVLCEGMMKQERLLKEALGDIFPFSGSSKP